MNLASFQAGLWPSLPLPSSFCSVAFVSLPLHTMGFSDISSDSVHSGRWERLNHESNLGLAFGYSSTEFTSVNVLDIQRLVYFCEICYCCSA